MTILEKLRGARELGRKIGVNNTCSPGLKVRQPEERLLWNPSRRDHRLGDCMHNPDKRV